MKAEWGAALRAGLILFSAFLLAPSAFPQAAFIPRKFIQLQDVSFTDPNADRILFWDDSANKFTGLSLGTGLSISGTVLSASGGVDADATFTADHTWNIGGHSLSITNYENLFFAGNIIVNNTPLGSAAFQDITAFAQTANNLSDVNAASARTNLGLGTAATQATTAFAQTANNLSDVNAASARTNLGATTLGANLFTLANPSAVRYFRVNADNTVSLRTAAQQIDDLDTDLTTWAGITPPASYAVGDLLYASAANTLAKLADVATGNALISGGLTTAPSWGKITTAHTTGIAASGANSDITSLTAATSLSSGANSLTIGPSSGASKTVTLQSTTSGGTATMFLTGNADQTTSFPVSGTAASPTLQIGSGNGLGIYKIGTSNMGFVSSSAIGFAIALAASEIRVSSSYALGFSSGNASTALDTSFTRSGAGVFAGPSLTLSGKLASTFTAPTALVTGNTTFAVTSNNATITGTNAVTIATITGGVNGMELHLLFADGNVTITDTDGTGTTDSVNLAGTSTNFVSAASKTLTLIHNGTKWYEITHSAN